MIDSGFLLADPRLCLVCGGEAARGLPHRCNSCTPDAWGDRFVYAVASSDRVRRTAELAEAMRFSYAYAESYIKDMEFAWGDYSDRANEFFHSLDRLYAGEPPSPDHLQRCLDCSGDNPPPSGDHHTSYMLWRVSIECPMYGLQIALADLSFCEDLKYGLETGSTWREIERHHRQQQLAARLERLEGRSVAEIIDSALEGGLK